MYKANIVFVKLNDAKNYYVTMNGIKIFDTLNIDTNATWTDEAGVAHDVWVIDLTPTAADATAIVDLGDALCDQVWEVVEYKTVEVYLNGEEYPQPENHADPTYMGAGDVRQIEVGNIWYATISNAFTVKINGVVQTGIVGATTTLYRYQVTNDTTVEMFQKYSVTLERPSGTEDATVTNMTSSCLYGDTVTATITPAGTYDKIMVVKAVDEAPTVYMLSGTNNVYTFKAGVDNGVVYNSHATTGIQDLTIRYEFTNQYVTIVYNDDDNALAPVNGLLGEFADVTAPGAAEYFADVADSYLSNPSKAGYIFRGWKVMEWNSGTSAYAVVDVAGDVDDVLTLQEWADDNYAFTVLDATHTHPDKLVAVYDRITPNVILIDTDNTDAYSIGTVKVDGQTIYDNGANWVTYSETMQGAGYALDYAKSVVLTLAENTVAIVPTQVLKVFVGTTEIVANANGEYVVTLANFIYTAYDQDIVIRVVYETIPVAFVQTNAVDYTITYGVGVMDDGTWAAPSGTDVLNMTDPQVAAVLAGVTAPINYIRIATVTGATLHPLTPNTYFAIPATATQVSINGGAAVALTTANFSNGLYKFVGQDLGAAAIDGDYVFTIEFLDVDDETVAVYVILFAADLT